MSSNLSPNAVLEAALTQESCFDASTGSNPEFAQGEAGFKTVADRLMEELFTDVERMLERGVDLSVDSSEPLSEPPQPDPNATLFPETSAAVPACESTSLILVPTPQSDPDLEQAESELADLALLAEQSEQTSDLPDKAPPHRIFGKLLLGLALTSLAAAAVLGWYFRDRLLPVATVASSPVAPSQPVDPHQKQTEEFLKYVGRSLDRIERDTKQQRLAAGTLPSPISSPVPSPSASPSASSPASPSLPLAPVYVPIPQAPPVAATAPPTLPATPQTIPPTSPLSPIATPPSTTAPPTAPTPTTPNIAVASEHVLIGVLELGDRSAALFEVDGTPQRIQIGEAVGSSGWTLVSVQNQEAIVRRNGEVRSIYVGQRF